MSPLKRFAAVVWGLPPASIWRLGRQRPGRRHRGDAGWRRAARQPTPPERADGLQRIERLNAPSARPKRRGRPKNDGERSVLAERSKERVVKRHPRFGMQY